MKIPSILLSFTILLLGGTFALYGAEEGSGSSFLDFFFKVVNFAVLFGVIYYFARKPIANVLKNSAQNAKQTIEDAREAQKRANTELAAFREKWAQMRDETQTMLEEARQDANAEKERIIAEAVALAEKMKTQAQVAIEQEYRKAEAELRQWTASETIRLAEDQIKEKIDDARHDNLIKKYLNQLQ